ncbi:MAG: signal peptidase II [Pseudobutyrivibrio sp.]|nr:signal peptidase II [Pseudobutyrivibrio sp.]
MKTFIKNQTMMITNIVIVIALVLLDQYTKLLAINNLKEKSDIILIPGVLQLHYLENTGAAFSMLEGKQGLFAIITPIMLLIMMYVVYKLPKIKKYLCLNYVIVFIIAGAIGNYIDRICNNYVVDFIYFSLINFPVFNVADCYVTVSVIALILLILFVYKDEDFEELKEHFRFKKNG